MHTTCHLDTSLIQDEIDPILQVNMHQTTPCNRDYSAYRDHILKAPESTIERTFQATQIFLAWDGLQRKSLTSIRPHFLRSMYAVVMNLLLQI